MDEETIFQKELIDDLKKLFDGCIVLVNDPRKMQGVPDLVILWKGKWAALECKRERKASKRPNQPFYVRKMDSMSFARLIYPENKQEVLDELQRSFGA